jgi:hydroxymethylpyrimidine/phosphomethylpyrimidine kinase
MKKVLSIAGSDCSGGAGIQADLKTFSAHGVYGMSVIVSVVAENTSHVIDIQDITPDMIEKQIDAVFEDIGVDAVKIGMLSTEPCMEAVSKKLEQYKPNNVVIDPVMYAKNGCPLMDPNSIDTLIKVILPYADLLTPNIPEAEKISNIKINNAEDMKTAAKLIYNMGCKNVLVKGGHAIGNALDVLYDGKEFHYFETRRINTKNTHGTGCTFSSAIASNLALGMTMPAAVDQAKKYITTAIEHSLNIGKGNGPTHHFYDLYRNGLNIKKSEGNL